MNGLITRLTACPQCAYKKEQTRKQLEEDEDEKRVQRPRVFNMREGGAERFMIARTRRQEPFKVSRRESRVKNMEPNSITEADTREKGNHAG
jgi:hypothetical protein